MLLNTLEEGGVRNDSLRRWNFFDNSRNFISESHWCSSNESTDWNPSSCHLSEHVPHALSPLLVVLELFESFPDRVEDSLGCYLHRLVHVILVSIQWIGCLLFHLIRNFELIWRDDLLQFLWMRCLWSLESLWCHWGIHIFGWLQTTCLVWNNFLEGCRIIVLKDRILIYSRLHLNLTRLDTLKRCCLLSELSLSRPWSGLHMVDWDTSLLKITWNTRSLCTTNLSILELVLHTCIHHEATSIESVCSLVCSHWLYLHWCVSLDSTDLSARMRSRCNT